MSGSSFAFLFLAGIETLLMPMATMAERLDMAVAAVQLVPWRWRLLLHCGAAQALRTHGHRRFALHGGWQMVTLLWRSWTPRVSSSLIGAGAMLQLAFLAAMLRFAMDLV